MRHLKQALSFPDQADIPCLGDYPDIPLRFMGFPANREDSPLWQ
jgi:hypothetical protein